MKYTKCDKCGELIANFNYEKHYEDCMGIKPKITGIYKLTCSKNNKCYIGQSVDIKGRLWKHKYKLENNDHQQLLLNDYNKYGWESFNAEILEICNKDELNEKEKYWTEYYKSNEIGYNIKVVNKHSEATKRQISKMQKGRKTLEETKTKMRGKTPWNKGLSKETNENGYKK